MKMSFQIVQYSDKVNNDPIGKNVPGRGLRQGDTLSPTFSFYALRGFLHLLNTMRGDIHGVKVCRGALVLTHLLFVDVCFLFYRVEEREANARAKANSKRDMPNGWNFWNNLHM